VSDNNSNNDDQAPPDVNQDEAQELEAHYSNPHTTARLQHAFAAALDYVLREQKEPPVRRVDILAALRASFMSLAHAEIIERAEVNELSARVNRAAFVRVLNDMASEIYNWVPELPDLPPDFVNLDPKVH
jgi:hypothetical protein